jgi:acyl-CoA synthetase (AMP-forming)/AMP-acid ligase II
MTAKSPDPAAMQMIHRHLQEAAAEDGDKIALTFLGESVTYRELEERANAVAHLLLYVGLGPGQRAAVVVSNRPEWIVCAHAVLKTGAAVITPLATWTQTELAHDLEITAPDVLIAETQSAHTLDPIETDAVRLCIDDEHPPGWTCVADAVAARSTDTVSAVVDPESEAVLLFSSGTTGLPKAVRHSHRSMSAMLGEWSRQAGLGPEDRVQFFLPLSTVLGSATVIACFIRRARISLHPRFDLETVLTDIEASRITIGMAAAPIAVAMAAHAELEKFDLSSLRYLVWGATPISKDVAATVSRRGGVRWMHVYGTSEHGQLASNPIDQPDRWRLDSAGLMSTDGSYRFLDENGVEVPPGDPGELWVKSPQTMLGYLPESANDEVFRDGYVRTGDIGYCNEEGFLFIVDRAKELIKVSGFSVSPVEIERTLFQHPDVDDCGVYPVDDAKAGQRPAVAIVRRPGSDATEQTIADWVAGRLSSYKRVTSVVFVDAIPRTASGKIHRKRLPGVVEAALSGATPATDG